MSTTELLANVASVAVVISIVGAGGAWLGRRMWSGARRFGRFLDIWEGTPEHPGVISRLETLEESIDKVTREVKPNGGASMRDAVNRIHEATVGEAPPPEIGA